MKTLFMFGFCTVLLATTAWGQAGSFGLFADTEGNSCSMVDDTPGLFVVHVVHVFSPAATAYQLAVEDGPGFTGTWLSDTVPFMQIGCSHCPTGAAFGYGQCLSSPIHVMSLNYYVQGTSAPCSWIRVVPPETTGRIEMVDCDNNVLTATGGTLIINPTEDCQCDVSAHATTWGRLKSLYID